MSKKDLDKIIPASNADKSSDDEYEVVESDSSDSESSSDEEPPKTKSKKISSKSKESLNTAASGNKVGKVRTKVRVPSRKTNVASSENKAIQPKDPISHATAQQKPIFTQTINEPFEKNYKVALANKPQYEYTSTPVIKETATEMSFKDRLKTVPIYAWVIVGVIVAFAVGYCSILLFQKYKSKKVEQIDEVINEKGIKGGSKKSKTNIQSATNESFWESKLPPSYEDSYYSDNEKEQKLESKANEMMKSKLPVDKNKPKCCQTKNNIPKRDARGRFIKQKK